MNIDQTSHQPRSLSITENFQVAFPARVAVTAVMPSVVPALPASDFSLRNKDVVAYESNCIEKDFVTNLTGFQHSTNPEKKNLYSSGKALGRFFEDCICEDLRILEARTDGLLTVDRPESELMNLLQAYRSLFIQIGELPSSWKKDYFRDTCRQQSEMIRLELRSLQEIRDEVLALGAEWNAISSCPHTSPSQVAQIRDKYKTLYHRAEKMVAGGEIEDHCHKCYIHLWEWESRMRALADICALIGVLREGAKIQHASEEAVRNFQPLIARTGLRHPISEDKKYLLSRAEEVKKLIQSLKLLQLIEKNPTQDPTVVSRELQKIASPQLLQNAQLILQKLVQEKGRETMMQTVFSRESFLSEGEIKAHASILEEMTFVEGYSSDVKKYLELRRIAMRSTLKLRNMRDQLRSGGLVPRDVSSCKYPEHLIYVNDSREDHLSLVTEEEQQSLQKILNRRRDPHGELLKCRKSIQCIQDHKNIIAHIPRADLRLLNHLCDEVASLIA